MTTNIGFDTDNLPYLEEGADEGRFVMIGDRLAVEPIPTGEGTTFTVDRSNDGGNTWVTILGTTPTTDGSTWMDWESLSYGDILYRAIAATVEGATAVTEITVEARSHAYWLSGGIGYALTCRLPLSPKVSVGGGRETVTKQYAGRTTPVVYKGEAVSTVYTVGGTITDRVSIEPTTSPDELLALIHNDQPVHLLRTPDGVRAYGAVPGLNLQRDNTVQHEDELRPWNAYWGYDFELTEATGV